MRSIYTLIIIFYGVLILLSPPLGAEINNNGENNTAPILKDFWVYIEHGQATFEANYTDLDGDEGKVLLYLDDESPLQMRTADFEPTKGQYFFVHVPESKLNDYTKFYLTADDNNGGNFTLKDEFGQPFLLGDFVGWGEVPILSAPDVYFDGDDWVFNVTYRDPDGDKAEDLWLNIEDQESIAMTTTDPDPLNGQVFLARVLESSVDKYTEFHFDVTDVNGSHTSLYDDDWNNFIVGNFIDSDKPLNGDKNGNGTGNDDGDENNKSSGFGFGLTLPEEWTNPEVIVGIIALVAMAVGSGVGIWLRKRKQKRFSYLLTKIDDVYGSYKMHPRKCERELEKIKTEVATDLKNSVIDENNYSILKDRINDIVQEIRQESVRSQVGVLPKDIELRVKDMLIDGKISRKEYDKFMVALKGSDMADKDKKQMEKLVDSWLKEDKNK